jgi:hypothetical protein
MNGGIFLQLPEEIKIIQYFNNKLINVYDESNKLGYNIG